MTENIFPLRGDEEAIETGTSFSPRFDRDGLIVAIVTDAGDGAVLMVAHMDREALARTITSGQAWFFSRSRKRLWRKGEESGNTLAVSEIRVDCDQDAILLKVHVAGAGVACHVGYRSCFYRSVPLDAANQSPSLIFDEAMRRSAAHPAVAKGSTDR